MTTMICAWCRRVRRGVEWVAVAPEPVGDVSHGICPACYEAQTGEPFETYMATGLEARHYEAAEAAFSGRAP